MELLDEKPSRQVGAAETALVFLAATAICLGVQYQSGAWGAELAGHPDEPSHLVSAVMVYEYLVELAPAPPIAFAERYYAYYPKVAIGHWPPGFHAMAALWFAAVGLSMFRVFLLIAVFTAAAAAAFYRMAVRELSRPAAAGGAAAFVLLPWTQFATTHVMTEAPLAFLCAAAVAVYASYLERPGFRSAVAFGLIAAAALLTKGAAAGLALTPPLAVLASRRWDLCRRVHFWTPAAIVVALAGPWYLGAGRFVPAAMGSTVRRVVGLNHQTSPLDRAHFWIVILGIPLAAAACVGLWKAFIRPAWKGRPTPVAAANGAFLAGVVFFLFALPESSEPRHIHQAAPAAIFFAVWALDRLARSVPAPAPWSGGAVAAVSAAVFFSWGFYWIHKQPVGLRETANAILEDEGLRGAAVLITSERFGEGALVAEIAVRRPKPDVAVLRATKVLARTTWSGGRQAAYFDSAADLARWLRETPVGAVVVDRAPPIRRRYPHQAQLESALSLDPAQWTLAARSRAALADSPNQSWSVDLLRSAQSDVRLREPIEVHMEGRLQKTLKIGPE